MTMRQDMKTLLDTEAQFQAAAHAVVSEKNVFKKAEHVDKVIVRLAQLIQVICHETRNLKNKVEGV